MNSDGVHLQGLTGKNPGFKMGRVGDFGKSEKTQGLKWERPKLFTEEI